MILVDTSVLIDFLKGTKSETVEKLEWVLQKGIPFGINSFIFQEVLQGVTSEKEYTLLDSYLRTQRFYHLKDAIESYASAARIYMDCRKKGITVTSTIDCLIAVTALEHDLLLLHNDSDFAAIARVVPLKIY
ncbi:MAG: PIN domain nuclease [Syntrophorhabdales bacterium]|jgi:predicted nucleic acid-binding protein